MHPLEKETCKIIDRHGLFAKGERVVVGVSGGPDSVALLHVLKALEPHLALRLVAVYVDHGLRPDETRAERYLVRQYSEELGAVFEAADVDVEGRALQDNLSIEHAARILRYGIFKEVAARYAATKTAVAHTADDQAEEVLLRLIRGTGRKGLSGMVLLNEAGLARPFLEIDKAAILQYLRDRNITYLHDSSNDQLAYLRNRVRNELLPYMEEHYNANIKLNLRQTAAILHDEELYLEERTAELYNRVVAAGRTKAEGEADELRIDCRTLAAQPEALRRRIIEQVFWNLGNQATFRKIEQLVELAVRGRSGDQLHFAAGLRATRRQGEIILSYPQGKTHKRGNLLEAQWKPFAIEIREPGTYAIDEAGLRVTFDLIDSIPEDEDLSAPAVEYLDFSNLDFPLTLRSPAAGDRFHPLGAPGSKKVGDFLTDRKIPAQARNLIPVLAAGDDIIALPGLRIDHRYRIIGKPGKILRIIMDKNFTPFP